MYIRLLATFVVLFFSFAFAYSADLSKEPPGTRDLIRDRQERLLEEQQKRLEELQQLPGDQKVQAPTLPGEDERCFEIKSIHLTGAELMSISHQREQLGPYENQCLGAGRLNALLKAITQFYIDRGYVTSRAYLLQQDLASGSLEIIVVEGKNEGIDSSAVASDREIAMTFPGKSGEVLNLRELEQFVEQINRLPSRPAQLELVPGQEVGGTRVQLKGERLKPWRVGFTRSNNAEQSTGEQQWAMSLSWDSPLGLADQFSVRGGGDLISDRWKHSANQGLFYSVPYGWWTFSYSYSQNYYRTENKGLGFTFHTDGESKNHQILGERVLHRGGVSKTAASLGISHLRTRNYIEGELIETSSQRLSEVQFGFNHGRRIGTAYANLDLGWQKGIGAFDAQREGDPKNASPVARYNKYTLTASYLQPFQLWGESFRFDILGFYQRSEDVLYSPQRISLGGLSSIRGFKDGSFSGDSGGYLRNQLRWTRPVTSDVLQSIVQQYGITLAYDIGAIRGDDYNGAYHGRLSGNAIEFNIRGEYMAATVSFARSLERPDAISRGEHPVYFRFDLFY